MIKSIADRAGSASGVAALAVFALTAHVTPLQAALPDIRVTAQSVEYKGIQLQKVDVRLNADQSFALAVGQAQSGDMEGVFENLAVTGDLLELQNDPERLQVRSRLHSGMFEAELAYLAEGETVTAELTFSRHALAEFREFAFLPAEYEWLTDGNLDTRARVNFQADGSGDLFLQFSLGQVAFDSPDGRFAGDSLAVDLAIRATTQDWTTPQVKGSIRGGELLIDDFYRNFSDGELDFSFQAEIGKNQWSLADLRISDNYSLDVAGRATIDLKNDFEVRGIEVNRLSMSFPGAYSRYIEPVLAPYTLDGLGVTGRLNWSGSWNGGVFQSGDLEIEDLSVVDTQQNRFAMTGLHARMRPGDHSFDSKLAWQGLLVGKINLGSGEAALDSEPGAFAITRPLSLDVLGGSLDIHEFRLQLPGTGPESAGEPDIRLRLDLNDLDMERLTKAFGWPSFSGRVSGRIPGVRFEDGVLDLDGTLLVDVFDGNISLDNLTIERPFGVLPSLAGDVEMENLDLQQLTSTFSFGQISGRIDGYVRELRMLDWKPVAFDAWLGTPERQRGSKGISRQAVNHLTTLGGGSATTALTSPLMRMFNNFSYKRLGFGCRMQNNICEVRGVSEDDVSVLIMEGAGVPKITIRAYNRSVDWPQLLAHLAAASEGEGIRVGD